MMISHLPCQIVHQFAINIDREPSTVSSSATSHREHTVIGPQVDYWLILDFEWQSQWSSGSTLKLGIRRVNVLTAKTEMQTKKNISNHRRSQWLKQ